MSTKTILLTVSFESSSGDKTYQTLFYDDASLSCDCPGWTRRTAPDGSRSCKHTRSIETGTYGRECCGISNPDQITYADIKAAIDQRRAGKTKWRFSAVRPSATTQKQEGPARRFELED